MMMMMPFTKTANTRGGTDFEGVERGVPYQILSPDMPGGHPGGH